MFAQRILTLEKNPVAYLNISEKYNGSFSDCRFHVGPKVFLQLANALENPNCQLCTLTIMIPLSQDELKTLERALQTSRITAFSYATGRQITDDELSLFLSLFRTPNCNLTKVRLLPLVTNLEGYRALAIAFCHENCK